MDKNETINSIQNTSNNSFLNIASLETEPILLVNSTDGTIHSYKFKNDKFLLLNKINLVQIYVDFLKQTKSNLVKIFYVISFYLIITKMMKESTDQLCQFVQVFKFLE